MQGKEQHINHQPTRGRRSNANFPRKFRYQQPHQARDLLGQLQNRQERRRSGRTCSSRREAGGRQTENFKPPIEKRYSNITKRRKTDLFQAQPRENKGTTKAAVISRRDIQYEEEEQIKAAGEEKISEISEDEGERRREEE